MLYCVVRLMLYFIFASPFKAIFIAMFHIYTEHYSFYHKFTNICKPEEGWYGQPKHGSKEATHVVISFARETISPPLVSLPYNPSTTSVGRDTTLKSTMIGYICL